MVDVVQNINSHKKTLKGRERYLQRQRNDAFELNRLFRLHLPIPRKILRSLNAGAEHLKAQQSGVGRESFRLG